MTISVVLVPVLESESLQTHTVGWNDPAGCDSFVTDIQRLLEQDDYLETPLLRPRDSVAGLYAYYNVPQNKQGQHNIRATRLAMACGLFSVRFYGPVLVVRSYGGRWESLGESEIWAACSVSPDLRVDIQQQVVADMGGLKNENNTLVVEEAPTWLADAAQQNYHDGAALAKVIAAMSIDQESDNGSSSSSDDDDEKAENDTTDAPPSPTPLSTTTEFVAKSPLCLHCRRMCSELCPNCKGAYFCTTLERSCCDKGWSHACLCPTWKLYSGIHREQLADFDGFFGTWQQELTSRPHQLGEGPYEEFLKSILSIDFDNSSSSWWKTELGGWSGGQSSSASQVDASLRQSYAQGFAPITDIPAERPIQEEDLIRAGLQGKRNSVGLLSLSSWKDYYLLRNIPPSSPVCLLCTFPLTIYFAIEQYGQVPVTVARMLKRPLRIHVVGAEKEMNFLDLFQELSYLLPDDLKVELVFVVRQDMLPAKCQPTSTRSGRFSMKIEFENLVIGAVSGTYGGDSLDPNFDCGSGSPDMVLALNAGLYAYDSWRTVITYLYHHPGVVGILSDYNEYSGVNCAALGGAKSLRSLRMNPFRQPRAMPVYSMNLPQFSNGFLYVFNEQELK